MFYVETGKGKSKYTKRYSFTEEYKAWFHYACINSFNGYKKRLVTSEGKVLARLLTTKS